MTTTTGTLADVLEPFDERLGERPEPELLTLTEGRGFVPQVERFKKRLATDDTSDYKLVRRGYVAFNPYLLWAGAIALNRAWDLAIISPAYPTFRVREGFDSSYVYWLLTGEPIRLRYDAISFGSVPRRRRAKVEDFLAIRLGPLPPFPEQRRIAAILDKADAVRRKRQQTLDLADQFLRSAFLDMFGDPVHNPKGWPVKRLGSLIRDTDRINYGVVQPGPHVPDGVPIVRVGDFSNGRVQNPTSKRISRDVESAYRRSRLAGDEILVACVGSIGQIAVAEPEMKGWNIVRAVARVPLGSSVEPAFVSEYLKTEFVQSYFQAETRTVTQPTLNIKQIRNTGVFLPPIEEQRRFVRLARMLSAQLAHLSRALSGVTELTDSLTQRAFRGGLA